MTPTVAPTFGRAVRLADGGRSAPCLNGWAGRVGLVGVPHLVKEEDWPRLTYRTSDGRTAWVGLRAVEEGWIQVRSSVEARRIMSRQGIASCGGLPALAAALPFRLYARINDQEVAWTNTGAPVLRVKTCRVQEARTWAGRPFFLYESVGLAVAYRVFAHAVERICAKP